jgi:hypothetical protein
LSVELSSKPDFDRVVERMLAWFECEILDRPVVQIVAPKAAREQRPLPARHHATLEERWTDVEYVVERADAEIANTCYLGEAVPLFFPNLGPELLANMLGCGIEFGETTTWSVPLIRTWDEPWRDLKVDPDNRWLKTLLRMTRLGLEVGRGKWITGLTDFHPGGDLLAALRDPQNLAMDLIDCPDRIKELMDVLDPAYYRVYEAQYDLMREAGQGTTTWLPAYSPGRYYPTSNDFSCMISKKAFDEFFLEELAREWAWLDHSLYHLDGPGAIRHLDSLLDAPDLHGIQWVPGANSGPAAQWINLLKRIQSAGKCIHYSISAEEVDVLMEHLRPQGIMFHICASGVEEAKAVLSRIENWR